MTTSNIIDYYKYTLTTQQKSREVGNKIVVGAVVKVKIGELELEK